MNIVYVIDSLNTLGAGTEGQLRQLIRGMVSRGHHVRLFTLRQTQFSSNLVNFECPIEHLAVTSLVSIGSWVRLVRFRLRLTREGVDIVHGFFNDVALALPVLFLCSGVKAITSRRDMGIWYTKGRLLLLRAMSRLPAAVICNCEAVAALAHQEERIPRGRIIVIRNGVPEYAGTPSGDSCRSEAVLRATTRARVLLVANVRPVKKIEDLIAAAALLKHLDIEYHVVGRISDAAYYHGLQVQIRECGVSDRFHFVGSVDNPRGLMVSFDIGVLTSDSEGLSNTLIEYFGAGLASVASEVGGNAEIITHGKTGLLYPKGDHKALARQILELASNPELAQRIGTNARVSFARFSIDVMLDQHERTYTATMNNAFSAASTSC